MAKRELLCCLLMLMFAPERCSQIIIFGINNYISFYKILETCSPSHYCNRQSVQTTTNANQANHHIHPINRCYNVRGTHQICALPHLLQRSGRSEWNIRGHLQSRARTELPTHAQGATTQVWRTAQSYHQLPNFGQLYLPHLHQTQLAHIRLARDCGRPHGKAQCSRE